MKSKLQATQTALSLGVPTFIGHGEGPDKLLHILQDKGDGTYVSNHTIGSINTRRQWISLHSETVGKIYIDEGAETAIMHNGTFINIDLRSEEHTSELQSRGHLVCRLLLEKKK